MDTDDDGVELTVYEEDDDPPLVKIMEADDEADRIGIIGVTSPAKGVAITAWQARIVAAALLDAADELEAEDRDAEGLVN